MSNRVASFAHEKQGAPDEPELQRDSGDWELHEPVVDIDKKDLGSPDDWVPRHPELTRLTGRHPLNCEPPLSTLMQHGYITPVSLHYVRNHGPAPRLDWSSHRITIQGMVDEPITLTMEDILKLPSVTMPVTLVCAGNRRKEENMIKKSIGFNWSASALSTNYWTGVRLSDVLKLAKVSPDARYVCFNGPTKELPKGQDGSYGTSLLLAYALNEANDVMVAYKQNGRWLTPDHGFPIRMIIPGFIGGRMVKWLKTIELTVKESDNHYHYFDNRVLPPHVDEALGSKEGWWYRPEFIINELNINSAISKPAHDETLSLDTNRQYIVSGYAYTGGGRQVIRVEVSWNGGALWQQAEIVQFEEPTKHGKYWCWVHWKFALFTADLVGSKELLVRAWDSSQNGQPADITWNVMGMMNNCYYRVKVYPQTDAAGKLCLRFQHPAPVIPGDSGLLGWRETDATSAALPVPATPVPVPVAESKAISSTAVSKIFTMDEVEEHDTHESCWFVHKGKVYDATPFLDDHPGGADSILLAAGQDATVEFDSIHSENAKSMLEKYYIGKLGSAAEKEQAQQQAAAQATPTSNGTTMNGAGAVPATTGTEASAMNGNGITSMNGIHAEKAEENGLSNNSVVDLVALNPKKKLAFKLQEKIALNHNTCLFRFALPTPQHRFGLPVGKHVFLYATIDGEPAMRAYTPTTADSQRGHFDLVVKIYRAGVHPRFPHGGKMSQHLEKLSVGDEVEFKGPVGHFVYQGEGKYTSHGQASFAKRLNFIAGGTGLTPCYSVIKAVLDNPSDNTECSLLYANNTEDDILLREELDELAAKHSNFRVWYTLVTPPEGWKFSVGFISLEMLQEHLLPIDQPDNSLTLMCGPPPMLQYACLPNLQKMGYTENMMVTF